MPMCNLIEHSNNYSKASASLWSQYRNEPALTDAGALDNIPGNSVSLKFQKKKKEKTDSTEDDNTKNVEIMVPLKYLRNF